MKRDLCLLWFEQMCTCCGNFQHQPPQQHAQVARFVVTQTVCLAIQNWIILREPLTSHETFYMYCALQIAQKRYF